MGPFLTLLFLLLVPANGLALWVFLRFAPATESPARRQAYNALTLGLVPVLCALFSLWLSTELTPHLDHHWLPVLSAMGWILAFPVLLMVGTFLRYYAVFRTED